MRAREKGQAEKDRQTEKQWEKIHFKELAPVVELVRPECADQANRVETQNRSHAVAQIPRPLAGKFSFSSVVLFLGFQIHSPNLWRVICFTQS